MIRLRPHHLLCIRNFVGKGYDAAFTDHMNHLVTLLSADGEQMISLIRGCDDLCAFCPHVQDGACRSKVKTDGLDRAVEETCGFGKWENSFEEHDFAESEDSVITVRSWNVLSEAAELITDNKALFQEVCGDCEWFALCTSIMKRREESNGRSQQQKI